MNILALDLSTHVGWAFGPQGLPTYGVWELGKDRNHGRYFSCLADKLGQAILAMSPDLVVFESPLPPAAKKSISSSIATVRVLIGLAAVTQLVCFDMSVPCEEASCLNARRLVMGKQPTGKTGVVAWCKMVGWQPQDDNAADALILWEYRHLVERKMQPLKQR